ncbi:MAG: Mpo1-like protein [Rhodospirillaceae bacterium]
MSENTQDKFTNYTEFWPYYLREHSVSATRALHYLGTSLALLSIALGMFTEPAWLLAAPFMGYGFAWFAHFFVEHNKPATLTYPAWSLYSDFRMFGLWLIGRLKPHLEAAGVNH